MIKYKIYFIRVNWAMNLKTSYHTYTYFSYKLNLRKGELGVCSIGGSHGDYRKHHLLGHDVTFQ